jgi:hypothetical protein
MSLVSSYIIHRIHFGPFELVRNASYDVVHSFGTLRWCTFGYDDTNSRWENVPESQFRLVHLINNINLIDLMNIEDYVKSFDYEDSTSLIEDFHNPNLHFYLLRDCKRTPKRRECAINSDRYQKVYPLHTSMMMPFQSILNPYLAFLTICWSSWFSYRMLQIVLSRRN